RGALLRLLLAPQREGSPAESVRQELLAFIERHTTKNGQALMAQSSACDELRCSVEDLDAALHQLEVEGTITILSQLPYVVLRVASWSGKQSAITPIPLKGSSNSPRVHREVPVSSAAAAAKQQQDGGAGEGERLLRDVLTYLGSEA